MAGTTVNTTTTGPYGSDVYHMRLQLNKVIDDMETLRGASSASLVAVTELITDYTALLADVTAIRTQVVALVADMATRISNHNTLTTKLNADAGVTDTNYAAAGAITAANPAALTATAIAATVPSSTAIDAAGDLTAAKVAGSEGSTTI